MQIKQVKRLKADAMNTAWRKLTPEQQLAELAKRAGSSKSQVARITAQIKEKSC